MVIYKLGIYSGNNSKVLINNSGNDTLMNLDNMTRVFNNEDELKKYLLSNKLMSIDDSNRKLSIIYKNNGYIKSLPVVYKTQSYYLNTAVIENKLNLLITNSKFLNKLIKFYDYGDSLYTPQFKNVENLRLFSVDLNLHGEKAINYDRELIKTTLDDLITTATTKYDKKSNSSKFNYRGFRDLAFFIYNFEEIERLKQIKKNIESLEDENEIMARKNNKWILSSEGEPPFPPNSEEEKQYLEEEQRLIEEYEKRFK